MFPFDIDDDEIEPIIEEDTIPADYEIDFTTGKLTGRVLTGLEAIKQWVRITLSVDRYYYHQYSWGHGCELNTLIGQNYDDDYIKSEVKRMIEDAILIRDDILGIENLVCSIDDDKLSVSFRINTIYGGDEINV